MKNASRYSDPMKLANVSVGRRRFMSLASLAAGSLIATACGSSNGSGLVEFAAPEPTAEELAAFSEDLPKDIEYGASLSEFVGSDTGPSEASAPPAGFSEIQWEDLVPPGSSGNEISAQFDERIAAVEPGSPEAEAIYAELQAEFNNQPINPAVAGDNVSLAGFVAPLTYSDDLVTEFLLVPYFGACVHVPPPPVNQTVMVTLADGQGLSLEDAWGAVWVAGTLDIDGAETNLATAGYSITGAQVGVYKG